MKNLEDFKNGEFVVSITNKEDYYKLKKLVPIVEYLQYGEENINWDIRYFISKKYNKNNNIVQIFRFDEITFYNKESINTNTNTIIDYIENDAEIAIPIERLIHKDGSSLTKKEYGKVLLEILCEELREKFTK